MMYHYIKQSNSPADAIHRSPNGITGAVYVIAWMRGMQVWFPCQLWLIVCEWLEQFLHMFTDWLIDWLIDWLRALKTTVFKKSK